MPPQLVNRRASQPGMERRDPCPSRPSTSVSVLYVVMAATVCIQVGSRPGAAGQWSEDSS